jgi:hypothetical protein
MRTPKWSRARRFAYRTSYLTPSLSIPKSLSVIRARYSASGGVMTDVTVSPLVRAADDSVSQHAAALKAIANGWSPAWKKYARQHTDCTRHEASLAFTVASPTGHRLVGAKRLGTMKCAGGRLHTDVYAMIVRGRVVTSRAEYEVAGSDSSRVRASLRTFAAALPTTLDVEWSP